MARTQAARQEVPQTKLQNSHHCRYVWGSASMLCVPQLSPPMQKISTLIFKFEKTLFALDEEVSRQGRVP
jgi:hypothetical protein